VSYTVTELAGRPAVDTNTVLGKVVTVLYAFRRCTGCSAT
jgi:hypothetical protein